MDFKKYIRDVPNFPKEGIIFKDITTLLSHREAFSYLMDEISINLLNQGIDKVIGIESRGFIMGGILADRLKCGFVPIRKPGKLPFKKLKQDYALEYGTDSLEMHVDAVLEDEKVIIIDDLLATGGTAAAAVKMVEELKGDIVSIEFLIELKFLNGRDQLKGYPVNTYIIY